MKELEGQSRTQAQPGGRAGAGHSLRLSVQDGQSRRHFKPKSSRERRHLFLSPHFQMDGEGTPNGLFGNGGRRQKDAEGQAGTLGVWHLASLLAFLKACGLPLSNKSLDELLKTCLIGEPCFPQQMQGEFPCKTLP